MRKNSRPTGKLGPGKGCLRQLYATYRLGALRRGLDFQLAEDDFARLTSKPCAYCGALPSCVVKRKRGNGALVYNGLDRVDNAKGYTVGNAVPCCKWCNHAKGTRSREEFVSWALALAGYQSLLGRAAAR